jgi:hypothetical protein
MTTASARAQSTTAGVTLYWLPLGAGGHGIRRNGRIFDAAQPFARTKPAGSGQTSDKDARTTATGQPA